MGLPVIEAHCEYRQPAHYDDELDIRTRGAVISPVRVAFDYEVVRRADGVSTAVGRTVHAAVKPAAGRAACPAASETFWRPGPKRCRR